MRGVYVEYQGDFYTKGSCEIVTVNRSQVRSLEDKLCSEAGLEDAGAEMTFYLRSPAGSELKVSFSNTKCTIGF